MTDRTTRGAVATGRALVLPLALAQFLCSYAATNMNVAISTIAADLGTTVFAIQAAITAFTLTMAALMIPGSKMTDIWGRKRCFTAGLGVYGAGALLATFAPGIGVLAVGYALLQGVGSALLVPPIYILVTVSSPDQATRARWFGAVSGAGGLGAAAGPLLGGLVTSFVGWRAAFLVQVLAAAGIVALARAIEDPPRTARPPRFDRVGAVLSALGLVAVVSGILTTGSFGWVRARQDVVVAGTLLIPRGGIAPLWPLLAVGAGLLALFVRHITRRERAGRPALLSARLFGNRTSNLGLTTQLVQWLVLQGTFFVTSVYLQQIWGLDAIATGLMLMPATAGLLAASAAAGRMGGRRLPRTLVVAGFTAAIAGLGLLIALVRDDSGTLSWVPGLALTGLGVGVMLTASVNVVQSSWRDEAQGEISGLSRCLSNLGSSVGTALAGSVVAASARPAGGPFGVALAVLAGVALLGLAAALALPRARPVPA